MSSCIDNDLEFHGTKKGMRRKTVSKRRAYVKPISRGSEKHTSQLIREIGYIQDYVRINDPLITKSVARQIQGQLKNLIITVKAGSM